MTRRRKDSLRPLTDAERHELNRLRRSSAAPAAPVARAAALLLVSDGVAYQDAARAVGRKSGDAVSHLVTRFNREGLAALEPRHGGGRATAYDAADRDRILREVGADADPGAGRDGDLVPLHAAARVAFGPGRPAAGLDLHPVAGTP